MIAEVTVICILYALVAVLVYRLLAQVSGSADLPTWKQALWAATWPLLPLWLYLN